MDKAEENIDVEAVIEADKNRIPGKQLILSGLIPVMILLPIILISWQIYHLVLSLDAMIIFLLMHPFFFARLYEGKKVLYATYLLAFLAVLYLSLPNLTHKEAKGIVEDEYAMIHDFSSGYPVERKFYQLTEPASAYFFEVQESEESNKTKLIIVHPNTGEILEL